jgi:hypothetical protein
MGWACCGREKEKTCCKMFIINSEGRDLSEDLGIGGKRILKWFIQTRYVRVWTTFTWFRIGIGGGRL